MQQAINLAQKLSAFSEHYQPRTIGQFNGHDLMVAKLQGTTSSSCCTDV